MSEGKPEMSAADWLVEFDEGELSPAAKRELADWLRESPVHVRELLELTSLRAEVGECLGSSEQLEAWVHEARHPDAAVVAPAQFLAETASAPAHPGTPRRRVMTLAAGLALIVALGGIGAWWFLQRDHFDTEFGEQRFVTLDDGSVMVINTESELRVHFSDRLRPVDLIRGEAFFRVSHDATRPFVVSAQGARIEAIGTQFNVRTLPGRTAVSVVEGVVEIRRGNHPALRVLADQEAHLLPGGGAEILTGAQAQHSTAWTRGRAEFDAATVETVLAELGRYQRLEVQFRSDAVRNLKLSGSFDLRDPESALQYIDSLEDVRVIKRAANAYLLESEAPGEGP